MRADRKDIFKSRFQEHYSRLCRIAYGYVSDQDDAEDIVQELFISVWNKRLDDMPEKEFAAYMTTSVRNSCVSFLRKRKEDMVSIDDHPASASCMPDETPEEGKTLQDILDSALETLPPRCKDVFLLAKLQGLKYREIAEEVGGVRENSRKPDDKGYQAASCVCGSSWRAVGNGGCHYFVHYYKL